MAKMIPAHVGEETKSSAEKKLFQKFQEMKNTDDWTILHSVGIAKHPTQSQGEADFVVVIPDMGVFTLEVKGGRISFENGKWYSTSRDDVKNDLKKGPVVEAQTAIHAFRDYVSEKQEFGENLNKCCYGFGVAFPDVDFRGRYNLPDLADEQIADKSDYNDMRAYLIRLAKYWQSRTKATLSPAQANKIVALLRPDFEATFSIATQIKNTEDQEIKLTENQQSVFDGLIENKRCIIKGSAGTGKTIIAANFAESKAKEGLKVGLFCYNKQLAQYLRKRTAGNENIVADSFTDYMESFLEGRGKPAPEFKGKDDRNKYYEETLPESFIEAFYDEESPQFDILVVDEAQDLIKNNFLDVFDCILKREMRKGSWYFFLDSEKQNLFNASKSNADMMDMLEDRDCYFTKYTLSDNCRNSISIIKAIDRIFGTETQYKISEEIGPEVVIKSYKKANDQVKYLEAVLNNLERENIPKDSIVILSPQKYENSIVSVLDESYSVSTKPQDRKGKVLFSTIQAFKGLESSVVIVTDIDNFKFDNQKSALYVGMTRAKSALYVFTHESVYRQIMS